MSTATRATTGIAAGLLALVLAGCSGPSGSGAPSSAPAEQWDGTAIESAVIAVPAPPQSFDPTGSVSATDRITNALMNASLYILEPDGGVKPGLAESLEFAPDFTSATVTLRDAEFSDGSPLTAKDVQATIDWEKSVESSSQASITDRIERVEAVDEKTVEFTFAAPYPSFSGEAGLLGIFPAGALDDPAAYFTSPTVTSGQYSAASPWASNRLELTVNPNYWEGAPAVTDLTLQVIGDGNSALSQLQSGQVDFAGDLAPNFLKQLDGNDAVHAVVNKQVGFYDLRLQNQSGPFSDPKVRQAVNAALDREAIVRAIWGDTNEPLSGFWPQSMDGYSKRPVTTDVAAAKQMLQGTECASGCTVQMIYSDGDFSFSSQLALMVQSQLKPIGITVDLQKLDSATLINRLFAADFDIVPGAMASSGNTPDALLANALLGTGFLKSEFTGYDSSEMNDLIATVDRTTDDDRVAAIGEVEQLFAADQPFTTLAPWVRTSASTLPAGVFNLVGDRARMETQR